MNTHSERVEDVLTRVLFNVFWFEFVPHLLIVEKPAFLIEFIDFTQGHLFFEGGIGPFKVLRKFLVESDYLFLLIFFEDNSLDFNCMSICLNSCSLICFLTKINYLRLFIPYIVSVSDMP